MTNRKPLNLPVCSVHHTHRTVRSTLMYTGYSKSLKCFSFLVYSWFLPLSIIDGEVINIHICPNLRNNIVFELILLNGCKPLWREYSNWSFPATVSRVARTETSVLWTSAGMNIAVLPASRTVSTIPLSHSPSPPAVLMGQNHPYKRTVSKQTSSAHRQRRNSLGLVSICTQTCICLAQLNCFQDHDRFHMLKVFYLKALTGQTYRSQQWSSNTSSVQTELFISVYCVLHHLRFLVLLCNFHSIFNSNFKRIL